MSDPIDFRGIPAGEQGAEPLDHLDPPHEHPFPGNVLMHLPWFGSSSGDADHAEREQRTVVTDPAHAAVVTSLVDREQWTPTTVGHQYAARMADENDEALHRPVIDLDVPVTLVPSSTPGHSHLYIDAPMSWTRYQELLRALVLAGIVEPGYEGAAKHRGHTAVRVPWLKKGDRSPELPNELRPLVERIKECRSRDELAALYTEHLDEWGDEHNAEARRTAIRWQLREQLQGRSAS